MTNYNASGNSLDTGDGTVDWIRVICHTCGLKIAWEVDTYMWSLDHDEQMDEPRRVLSNHVVNTSLGEQDWDAWVDDGSEGYVSHQVHLDIVTRPATRPGGCPGNVVVSYDTSGRRVMRPGNRHHSEYN